MVCRCHRHRGPRRTAAMNGKELIGMEFRVLGPVAVLQSGLPVPVASKPLHLLAVLLLAPGHRAPHSIVAHCLWPGEESNSNRIRQCFHQLRQSVPGIFQRNERGYCQIQVVPQSVDCIRFQESLRAADAAKSAAERLKALRSALGEVRGTPLEGLPGEGFQRKREEISETLREATAACVLAELDCGETERAYERAAQALEQWPESEPLLALNVRALRGLGRDDRIGPLLTRWERGTGRSATHLLLSRTTAEGPDRVTVSSAPAPFPAKHRQLPAQPGVLIGRRAELEQLREIVLGLTRETRVAAVGGMPGVGKTFLAVRTAELVMRHFPDGVLYVDLHGYSPGEPEPHARILVRILNDLGVSPATPTDDGMASAYRNALANRAVLLVLDNARDEDHVRPLLPAPGASAAIITSRRKLHGLGVRESAGLVDLLPLDDGESAELLRIRLGEDRTRTALPFLPDLVDHCGGLPLALCVVAARIAHHPARDVAGIVRELRQENTRLRSLDLASQSESVRLSLELSHRQLPAPAARLLWQLAVHPGPTFSWQAVRSLEPDNRSGLSEALDSLTGMNLVAEMEEDRYFLHDVIRLYAGGLANRRSEAERAAVVERVLYFLLHNARACDRVLDPDRRLPIGEPQGVEVVTPGSAPNAMRWFETEYPTLVAAVGLAREHGLDRYTWLLPMTLVTFQWRTHRYLDALDLLTPALTAAERVADTADVGMIYRMLAGTHQGLQNPALAVRALRSAVRVSEEDGDTSGAALGRHALGVVLRGSGATVEAHQNFAGALAAFEQLGDPLGRGAALNGVGNVHYDLGRYDEALEYCLRSLAVLDRTDDLNGRAYALFSLGRIRVAREEYEAAVEDFRHSHGLYRTLAYRSREVRALVWLGEALNGANRPHEASAAVEKARFLLRGLGEHDPDAAVERERHRP
ncbi:NB-ARC domain-containing protein [Streptomyces clavuligerus]|uniref:Transcriptional regulator, SARP family protein n=2 Tax=Streptomyces clavuligerus TaxID=1901 RepID=E2Q0K0_STRCL|nr:NB-ARC domain-containing protein [Streptomyces clavuligerus]EFG10543.1 transcriptional regulator, SARP family protein [Streptomyces clavuligerus]